MPGDYQRNIKSGYGYQYGSEALDYRTLNPVLPKEEVQPAPQVRKKEKPDVVFGLKMSVCWGLIFASTFIFVGLYAQLTTKQVALQSANEKLQKLQSSINSVQSVISSSLNLEDIQQLATTQLNMSEPLPYQVVYIQLPQTSYTVYTK